MAKTRRSSRCIRRTFVAAIAALVVFTESSAATKRFGDPKAVKGGTITVGFPGYPKHLLTYLAFEELSGMVNSFVLEPLLETDPETYDPMPLLAKSWSVTKDNKEFTVKLDPAAKFSDGKPVTADDVKFTWDTLLDKKNKTAPYQAFFASYESLTVVDKSTLLFKVRTVHFDNLRKLSSLLVLPKHIYGEGDFNKAFGTTLVGSGPYVLETAQTGERIVLKRNPDYWGASLAQNIGRYNFDKIVFKAVADYNVQFEIFKKGEIDYFYFLSSKMWATETKGPQFENNYIKKLHAETKLPGGTQGIVWNLRRPLFQDVRVRTALSHLYDRERMLRDLMYNVYSVASGIVPMKSEWHSPKNKPVLYDPAKAKKLLTEAGWKEIGSDGVLVKDGKRFEFEVLTDNPLTHRYLTIYQEDLKKMGIKLNIRTVDWATRLKLADDWQFDGQEQARGREIEPADFGVVWGSDQADIKGSGNTPGYKNPEVDELCKKIDLEFNRAKRIKLVQRLDEIIGRDQPLTFTWERSFTPLAHWNRFSFPGKGYFKYSSWRDVFQYWWYDKDKDERLKKAVAEGKPFKS